MNGILETGSVVILTQAPELYSVKRLVEAAQAERLPVAVIDPIHLVCRQGDSGGDVFYCGRRLAAALSFIPRVSHRLPEYGWMVLRHLEQCGYSVLNPPAGIARAQHKFDSLRELAAAGLAVPRTFCTRTTLSVDEALEYCGGLPVIMKLIRGSQGQGVIYVESVKALNSILGAVVGLDRNVLIQQYIPEAGEGDIRALVLNGQVLGSIRRLMPDGEFRSNVHRGAVIEPAALTAGEEALCIRAAALFDLRLAGVDFVRTDRGPVFLEVNPNPGFEGFESGTGIDAARQIVLTTKNLLNH